ncbi:MAG: rRNA pseudouridine synthase [Phycisphaerales bacterium]|nr:rRNA pseudouridine synthase [Phycisphaerales bacterium]
MARRSDADMPDRYDDKSRGPRLQRVLADAGVAARRVCEELILAGDVEVNGRIVDTLPAFVDPEIDRIRVQGRPIKNQTRKIYVILNKPPRTVTTTADEPDMDRRTVTDLVDHPSASRLYPVGRLDYDTTGLLLLTNDGDLANKLTHPRFGVVKTYHAVVKGKLTDEDAAQIAEGIYLAERKAGKTTGASRTARVEVSIFRRDRERTILELRLQEGRNRQVRRMLAAVGCPVKKLQRVAMGPLVLKGLPSGAWRELTKGEVDALRRSIERGKKADMPGTKPGTKQGKKKTTKKRPMSKREEEVEKNLKSIVDPKRIKAVVATSDRPAPKKGARRLTSGEGRR